MCYLPNGIGHTIVTIVTIVFLLLYSLVVAITVQG
jgi:hypothetical protein